MHLSRGKDYRRRYGSIEYASVKRKRLQEEIWKHRVCTCQEEKVTGGDMVAYTKTAPNLI